MRFFAAVLVSMAVAAQTPPARQQQQRSQPAQTSSRPYSPQVQTSSDNVLRISVTLVQIDAVVTDSKGKHIGDLKPGDFEILQDGKPQKITHFTYIESSARPAAPAPVKPVDRKAPPAPPPPPARMRASDVRRTIALVVDDLGLSFESIAFVRQALRKFVDQQMQPGDLVAIVRTGAGMGAFQQFTSDKRALYAAIERVKWNMLGRGGVSAFAPVSDTGGEENAELTAATERADEFREEYFSVGTLGALNYIIRGLKELPGRKSVVVLSDGLRIFNRAGESDRVLEQMQHLTDLANRSSVVIYTIDARGLPVLGLTAADNVKDPLRVQEAMARRSDDYFESQNGLNYLAAETGGMFLHDNNDIGSGIRQALDDQSGYYLIGYNPGEATFRDKDKFHRVKVRVKREGLKVRSRNGFYGVPEQDARPVIRGRDAQLANALISPFGSAGVPLRLSGLFSYSQKIGSFVYSLLHIGAKELTFAEEPDGWHKAVIDILMITSGGDGAEIDRTNTTYTLRMKGETFKKALDYGFEYRLNHPVKKPGAYQLRVAVRDALSEKVGSATQFIEVPDLKKGRLTLSGIVLRSTIRTPAQTAAQPGSAPPGAGQGGSAQSQAVQPAKPADGGSAALAQPQGGDAATLAKTAPGAVENQQQPDDGDPMGSPSLRIFKPGTDVTYAFQLMNAQVDNGKPQVDTQLRLFRDTKMIYSGKPQSVSAASQPDAKNMILGGRFKLGARLAPGEYVMQVVATDRLAGEKNRTAVSSIDFEVSAAQK